MGTSTITRDPQHGIVADAKSKSTLGEWLRARRERRAGDEASRQLTELLQAHLNTQSRYLLGAVRAELLAVVKALSEQQRAAASPTDLDGSHPAYQLRHIGMLALDGELRAGMTWRGAVELLRPAWDQLNARADEQDAFERHTPVNKAEAEADGALLFASGRRGKPIGPGSERGQVAVAEIVDRAMAATTPTALQMALTPDVLERLDAGESVEDVAPTQVMPVVETVPASTGPSPVHVPGDDLRPPVPVPGEDAGPGDRSLLGRGSLPKRHKIVSFPARMSATPGVPLDGERRDAMDLAVKPGAFLLVDNTWRLVSTVAMDAPLESVTAHLAGGGDPSFEREEQVWLLPVEAAAPLAAAHRAELNEMNEMEASR